MVADWWAQPDIWRGPAVGIWKRPGRWATIDNAWSRYLKVRKLGCFRSRVSAEIENAWSWYFRTRKLGCSRSRICSAPRDQERSISVSSNQEAESALGAKYARQNSRKPGISERGNWSALGTEYAQRRSRTLVD